MKKILFVNDEMTMGGVARILNTLLGKLDPQEYELDLLVLHPRGELLKEVPSYVNILKGTSFFDTVDMPLSQCKGKAFFHKIRLLLYMKCGWIEKRIRKERKKILGKHYDIEFSAKEGFCTVFTAAGDSTKKLNWIQVDYKQHNYSAHHMALMKKVVQKIDTHIACSQNVLASYEELFGISGGIVIHNMMDEEKVRDLAQMTKGLVAGSENIQLISVARFHPQKSIDRLLRVFARLGEGFDLILIGDGEEKEKLISLAKQLHIFEKIKWLGLQENPYPDIRAADLFVMSSLYEGYPTITVESLLCGTPVLTTRVAGVSEQLLLPETGWIVENSEEALFQKLDELRGRKEELHAMKVKLLRYRTDNEEILKTYRNLFRG